MTVRGYGAAMCVLGVATLTTVFLPWYRADVAGRTITATGVAVSGEAVVVALTGLVVFGAGVAIALAEPDPFERVSRWLGVAVTAAGILGVAWSFTAALTGSVSARPSVSLPPEIPVGVQPAVYVAAAASAFATCAGLAWLRAGAPD